MPLLSACMMFVLALAVTTSESSERKRKRSALQAESTAGYDTSVAETRQIVACPQEPFGEDPMARLVAFAQRMSATMLCARYREEATEAEGGQLSHSLMSRRRSRCEGSGGAAVQASVVRLEDDFDSAVMKYSERNFVYFLVRTSSTLSVWNHASLSIPRRRATIPAAFEYAQKVLRCTHGFLQDARGAGHRKGTSVRFRNCLARLTAQVIPVHVDSKIRWKVFVSNQTHTHDLSKEAMNTYLTSGKMSEPSVLSKVDAMVDVSAPFRGIAEVVSREIGTCCLGHTCLDARRGSHSFVLANPYMSIKQIKNLVTADSENRKPRSACATCCTTSRLGADGCSRNADRGATRAAIQVRCVLMDFTHNRNNLGFYLGTQRCATLPEQPYPVLIVLRLCPQGRL
ncbi:hypothetical protein PybrP1_010082 [[Pythium] brassicae (nom. inval.)]|nr:hypothetical protein PybrP1_010082 [[Pythium] brassicae (nom. inval.)]